MRQISMIPVVLLFVGLGLGAVQRTAHASDAASRKINIRPAVFRATFDVESEQFSIWIKSDAAIELCSGIPSFIENDIDEWVDNVGRYFPWSAELTSIEDFR